MARTFAVLLVATFIVHASSLVIKSHKDQSDSKQANDVAVERKLEKDGSQMYDMDALRRSYDMLLDNIASGEKHPFGWSMRRFRDHPLGVGNGRFGDVKYRNHPFRFNMGRHRDHPFQFGFGTRKLHGDYIPSSKTYAFHGKRGVESDEEDSLQDEQNTSIFHGKRNENLVSEWLDDKIRKGNMRE